MAILKNKKTNAILISQLCVAEKFNDRLQGLLGTKDLSSQQGIWIHRCNSIHTFFMNYPIDCIFINEDMVVQKIYKNIPPWRMTFPVWKANSVIEVKAGVSENLGILEGDQLYVGT